MMQLARAHMDKIAWNLRLVCIVCGDWRGEALRLITGGVLEKQTDCRGTAGEIGYTQAVLPLVLCRAATRDGKAGKLFWWQEERLKPNPECPFGSIWEAVGPGRAGDSSDVRNRGMGS